MAEPGCAVEPGSRMAPQRHAVDHMVRSCATQGADGTLSNVDAGTLSQVGGTSGNVDQAQGEQVPEVGKDRVVRVVSWNANGIRARIRKGEYAFLLDGRGGARYDVVCIQETKASPEQIAVPRDLAAAYPYRLYETTRMRKGQSGTALWSRTEPVARIAPPPTDVEGRICAADFGDFLAVSVYVPNSGT